MHKLSLIMGDNAVHGVLSGTLNHVVYVLSDKYLGQAYFPVGLTQLALDLLSWLSICSRVLSVAWGSVGVGFGVRFKAPSPPGSRHSVHDA